MSEMVPVIADINNQKRLVVFDKDGNVVGWLGTINDNEIELSTTMRDPVKLRLSIHENKVESNLGAISWNRLRDDGQHHQDAELMGRLTANKKGGAVYIAVRPQNGNDHEDVQEVAYFDSGAVIFRAPIQAPNFPPPDKKVSRFYTDGGKFCINWQDDTGQPAGIAYDTHGSLDEATWTAVGRIGISPL